MPPDSILKRQVLERIIIDKLQRQLAKSSGVNITDDMLKSAVAEIAQRNNLSVPKSLKINWHRKV